MDFSAPWKEFEWVPDKLIAPANHFIADDQWDDARRCTGEALTAVETTKKMAAIKVDAKDLAPRNEQKSLEDLRVEMQKHWERLVPVLDLEAFVAPSDGIANREVQEG